MYRRIAKSVYRATPLKPLIMRALRRVYQPSERVYRHLHFKAPIVLDLPNGACMRIHHFGNQVENDLFWAGFGKGWEKETLIAWLWLNQSANVVLDIGANTGVYALSAMATRPQARIIAVEPVMRIHAKLAANIELNRYSMEALNIALSNANGTAKLYDPGGEHAYSASLNAQMLRDSSHSVETVAKRLDDLADEMRLGKLDVLKIDVEMHEPEVIAGGLQRINADRPAILIEILNREIGNHLSAILDGYIFYEIGQRVHVVESPGAGSHRNYLLLHRDDPRVLQLGRGIDFVTLQGWVTC